MLENWHRMDYWMDGYHKGVAILVTIPVMGFVIYPIALKMDVIPLNQGILFLLLSVGLIIFDFYYLPRLKERYIEVSKRFRRTYPIPIDKAKERLEAGYREKGIACVRTDKVGGRLEQYGGNYQVTFDRVKVDLYLHKHGEAGTEVQVQPPEDDWSMEGILIEVDDVLFSDDTHW